MTLAVTRGAVCATEQLSQICRSGFVSNPSRCCVLWWWPKEASRESGIADEREMSTVMHEGWCIRLGPLYDERTESVEVVQAHGKNTDFAPFCFWSRPGWLQTSACSRWCLGVMQRNRSTVHHHIPAACQKVKDSMSLTESQVSQNIFKVISDERNTLSQACHVYVFSWRWMTVQEPAQVSILYAMKTNCHILLPWLNHNHFHHTAITINEHHHHCQMYTVHWTSPCHKTQSDCVD